MKEISLHILDIVQNSLAAGSQVVLIKIIEDLEKDIFKIKIKDNGSGMSEENQKEVLDPFVTSRQTREVGLGLPFLKKAAENCNGWLKLESKQGKGTTVKVLFEHTHIDRAPLGDIAGTITALLTTNPDLNLKYHHIVNNKDFVFDTKEIKKELDGVPINQSQILNWINDFINENLKKIRDRD